MYPEAIEDANLALSVERCDNMALEVLGDCYLALGDNTKAEKCYSDIISCSPTESRSYIPRGNFYLNQKDFKKAIVDFSGSVDLDQTNMSVLALRGAAYLAVNEIDLAISDLTHSAEKGGGNENYFVLAKCYLAKNSFAMALENAKNAKDQVLNSRTFGPYSFKNLSDINKIIEDCEVKLK